MTKSQLISAVAETAGITKSAATSAVDALLSVVTDELKAGNEVVLHGVGKLHVKHRNARAVRNPSTGQQMQKAAHRAVGFKPAKQLKDAVNA